MPGPNPDRTPCGDCGSFACIAQSPLMCRHTGTVRVLNPFEVDVPGSVRLRTISGDTVAVAGNGGAPATEVKRPSPSAPRRSAPQTGRQSTPGRRKK